MQRHRPALILALSLITCPMLRGFDNDSLRRSALQSMKQAVMFYRDKVATHGGYVYHYSTDLSQRWGEGSATPNQIWVQPPGTPTVGIAFLEAWEATQDEYYLDAAREAAEALIYGQLRSGGWTNCIDFNPKGARVALYRNGKGGGRNTSSLDDGQTQSALLLLIKMDRALGFQNKHIHEAANLGLEALLSAQYPNGAFPQVWDDDEMPNPPARKASYPDDDWATAGRIKNYWDMYTLNDNVAGYVADVLMEAHRTYFERDDRFEKSLRKLGDFLVDAQLPDPQPAWAQQYNYEMQPIWARKFEPPAIASSESQDVVATLLDIHAFTNDERYLEPVPKALEYLEKSQLDDGRLARYYELKSNRPLYLARKGKTYSLTYDDHDLPKHYGWKWDSRVSELSERYSLRKRRVRELSFSDTASVPKIIKDLDPQGRWISRYGGERLVGQPKMREGTSYISSAVFSHNLTTLARFLSLPANR